MMRCGLKTVPLICLLLAGIAPRGDGAEIRYAEAAYLDALKMPPMRLKVARRTPISMSRDLNSAIAFLAKGQTVELVGYTKDLFYVSGRIATGPVKGWVAARDIQTPPPAFIEKLKQAQERHLRHQELIARHEIAMGMSREEVETSLGKPDRRVSLQTADGRDEQWFYITYKYVPQTRQYYDDEGRFRQTITYRRVPSGHKLVVFRGDVVTAIEENIEEKTAPHSVDVIQPRGPSN